MMTFQPHDGARFFYRADFSAEPFANISFYDREQQEILFHLSLRADEGLAVCNRRGAEDWSRERPRRVQLPRDGVQVEIRFAPPEVSVHLNGARLFRFSTGALRRTHFPDLHRIGYVDFQGGISAGSVEIDDGDTRPREGLALSDMTQGFGKLPLAFNWSGADMALISAHKLGGPKGVGALVLKRGLDVEARIRGGGQEMGRRSGTENVIGIAGFGAAAERAARDLADGVWEAVAEKRDLLEAAIAEGAKHTIFVGKGVARLPNTSCMVTPGWKGETQVMQMDLAGFAVSAGSACSSGKVKPSRVLEAMGFDADAAASALRVSIGPDTTEDEILRFAETWLAQHAKFRARAA